LSACPQHRASKTTKRCCRGTARRPLPRLPENKLCLADGVYGALTILYWERNGFCLWLKRLEAERFKTKPDVGDEAIELTVDELNWLLDGIDLWRNRPHQVLTPRFVA